MTCSAKASHCKALKENASTPANRREGVFSDAELDRMAEARWRQPMDFDRTKFKRLVHYVAWKAGKRHWFGAVKLNKVLWYADARTYVLRGNSITGETYIREKFGPVPRHIKQICEEMERERTIECIKEGKLNRVIALTPAKPNWFSPEELQSINYWIEHIDKEHTAASISDATHDYVGRSRRCTRSCLLFWLIKSFAYQKNCGTKFIATEIPCEGIGIDLGGLVWSHHPL